jgi:hypothetical protein
MKRISLLVSFIPVAILLLLGVLLSRVVLGFPVLCQLQDVRVAGFFNRQGGNWKPFSANDA